MLIYWECGKPFPSGRRALKQHRKNTNHIKYRRCYDIFNSAQDRVNHETNKYSYYIDCDREFANPNNARQANINPEPGYLYQLLFHNYLSPSGPVENCGDISNATFVTSI